MAKALLRAAATVAALAVGVAATTYQQTTCDNTMIMGASNLFFVTNESKVYTVSDG